MKYQVSIISKDSENEIFKGFNDYLTSVLSLEHFTKGVEQDISGVLKSSERTNNFLNVKGRDKWENIPKLFAALNYSDKRKEIKGNLKQVFNRLMEIESGDQVKSSIQANQSDMGKVISTLDSLSQQFERLKAKLSEIVPSDAESKTLHMLATYQLELLQTDFERYKLEVQEVVKAYEGVKAQFIAIINKLDGNRLLLSPIRGINEERVYNLEITVKSIQFNEENFSMKVANSKVYKVQLRKYTTFIPVVSSGVFYTNLTFNRYGTGVDDSGNTIIAKTADDSNELVSAAHLNFYRNTDSSLNWFWQFGIGLTKKKPFVSLGVGLSLIDRLNLSLGGIWTWQPELSSLSIGDLVAGTAEIEDNISYKFKSKPNFYLGLSFNLTK